MDIEEKIRNDYYRNKKPYSISPNVNKTYKDEENRLKNEFKADLKAYLEGSLGPLTQSQFEAVFSYVWSEGHANGYYEVFNCTLNILPILEEFIKKD